MSTINRLVVQEYDLSIPYLDFFCFLSGLIKLNYYHNVFIIIISCTSFDEEEIKHINYIEIFKCINIL